MSELNPARFTHVHVHSHFSLLQGTASIAELTQKAVGANLPALALTDTNALYGVVAFVQACRAVGIQPITGMTVTIAPPPEALPETTNTSGQLVLLATGSTGYQSLCRLSACLQAHPDRDSRQRHGLAWRDLKDYHQGLICIEAGQSGCMSHLLMADQRQAATRYAARLGSIFSDRCYVGLELHQAEDASLAHELTDLCGRFGISPVVAQPVYTLGPEDSDLVPLLAAIDRNCRLDEVPAHIRPGHWLAPNQIAERFAEFPEAITNVGGIIGQCRPAFQVGTTIWPAVQLEEGQTPAGTLKQQARRGLEERLTRPPKSHLDRDAARLSRTNYETRLKRELAAIIDQGFSPLFLLVADIVRFARQKEIPVSTRGSVANSLVAYVLGITTIDPVAHKLLFERFLNPSRANLPDIDLDFCSRGRDEVLAYVRDKYGKDRVALVGSMSTMQPKSAIREVAKAYGLSERRIKVLSEWVPRRWHPDPRRRRLPDAEAVLERLDDETEKKVVRQAFRLVGQPHHLSLHPGGIVITPGSLTDYVPIQWAAKGYLATQLDYRDVETLGLPKIDLLGIRALTVLADASDVIRSSRDPDFSLEDIPLDDETTGDMLSSGETIGVFQCESVGAQRTLRQLRARDIGDLAVANAFFKPGPATGGMAQSFIRRYRGEEKVSFLHPALESILGETRGVLLFQEQVLRIAVEIAGLNWEQADHLRRGMSKFRAKEMAAMRIAFVTGCQQPAPGGPGFTREQADKLWQQVIAFAGYGFNQGHATAYAEISYQSAYLKAHYPAEFLYARLMDRGGFHHPVIYLAEARRLGMAIRPPHVNVSGCKITLTYDKRGMAGDSQPEGPFPTLWLGLGQVRNLRRRSIKALVERRPFSSLGEMLDRVRLQPKEVINLIQCGALAGLGESRAMLLAEAATISRAGSARQMAFDFMAQPNVPSETAAQRLAWEMHILGSPISVHPLDLVNLPDGVPIRELRDHLGALVTVKGVRLPGWTGGKSWFLSDGHSYVIAQGGKRSRVWDPMVVNGRYRVDEWGGGWFQVES